ncbi:3-hydroxyacyl-CoA dehydrogenase type-2-like [Arctopsyche grandis]|uniref:3-hydroxyacyl-CoA dehydrogenase type-2-like n=1 Tax=Arctopsyche grandis TaxID=121162 RepID=UPI00406D6E49
MAKNIVSFVTGGASGLGKATVELFLKQGVKVVLCDLPISKGSELAKEYGENVLFTPADICSEADITDAIKATKEKFGRLDTLVNCAGTTLAFQTYNFNKDRPHRLDDFEKVLMTNIVGTFNVTRLAVGLMGKNKPNKDGQRGVIVNTSCVAAFDGQMGQVGYAASKAAIAGMTLPMARDLASQGIRVVTIAPGFFDTPLLDYLPEKIKSFLAKSCTFPHRFGQPAEFAQFVSSVIENPILNGEVIRLDAGLRFNM